MLLRYGRWYPASASSLLRTELQQCETFYIYRWLGEYFSNTEMLIRLHYSNVACSLQRAKTLSTIQPLGDLQQCKVSQTTPKGTNKMKFNSNSTSTWKQVLFRTVWKEAVRLCLLHYMQLSYQGGFPEKNPNSGGNTEFTFRPD